MIDKMIKDDYVTSNKANLQKQHRPVLPKDKKIKDNIDKRIEDNYQK